MKVENAKITGTMLGVEDHGILTCMIYLSGNGWSVGFGGYGFDRHIKNEKPPRDREGVAYGMEFIRRILAVLEVDRWEKLPGQIVRAKTEGVGGRCCAIGHALKDQWFEPQVDLDYLVARERLASTTNPERAES